MHFQNGRVLIDMVATMATPAQSLYLHGNELRPQHSRDNSRDSGIFHTTKGLWNAPGQNNCFLNSAVQVIYFLSLFKNKKIYHFHAVSRTQHGRQREHSVKTLRSPLSAKFWRHCVLNGGTQRRALHRHESEEMEL